MRLRDRLLVVAVVAVAVVLLGVTVSLASGREPLPEPPRWHSGVTAR